MKAIESTEQAAEVAKMYLEKRGYSEARSEAEATAIEYLSSMENVPDARVRFDVLSLIAMGGGRVFIRHHINALGDD